MNTKHLFAAASAAAALAVFPAAASAATVTVNGTNITVAGDATDETITIADANGVITVDGAATTAAANDTFDLTVNAGAGADTVRVNTAALRTVTINGDAGNDSITGSPDNDIINGGNDLDTLNGAAGNDRISGNDANDTMNGDAGNDVMVWNPGDDDDVMNGGAGGGDDAELNGGNGPESFAAAPAGNRVRFERLSPGPFQLDVGPDTERLVLNANGGDDTMASNPATPTAMLLNGGTGLDTMSGGANADFLNGGDDNDALDGGPGIDRLVGDRGNDSMDGAAGDDTLVWNNGDGSDVMDGRLGLDKIEVNGAAGAGDAFEVQRNGQRDRFDRTNLGPFSLDIGTAELLDVRGQGGDDTFLARAGNTLAVLADGGDGNDALTGASEADTFFGGAGDDTLDGGLGPDLLDGQSGNDRILARDGTGDLVRGGSDADFAQVDKVDIVDGVEQIDRPKHIRRDYAHLYRHKAKVHHGYAKVWLKGARGGSEGKLWLYTAKRYKVGGKYTRIALGTVRYDLDGGERKRYSVRLSKTARYLVKHDRLKAWASTGGDYERLTLKY
ncbi:MAG TPA: calcium-binding protein [Solirubrobacteraceae bacterium]|nr:calcium-binding protein [Solirubrobacteraceae bacterium]